MRTYAVLFALLVGAAGAALVVGPGDLGDAELAHSYLALRGARLIAAGLVGAALAVAGVLVQGLFRNPLADPSVLGTTAGANLGGRLAMWVMQGVGGGAVGSVVAPELVLPLGCFAGAALALAAVLIVQRVADEIVVILLAGFLLSSLFVSLGGFVTSLAMERWELARAMLEFALGDVTSVGLRRALLALPLVVIGSIAAWFWSRPLDLLLSGEDEAASLGVDVREVRRACVLWTALLTAAAVAIGGSIGFVGLIVPHVLRRFVGAAHRRLIPASALLGASFVIACDALTRMLPTRSELPLGVVTGLIGAPLFLVMLLRARREALYGS